jgi:hypothetical protein
LNTVPWPGSVLKSTSPRRQFSRDSRTRRAPRARGLGGEKRWKPGLDSAASPTRCHEKADHRRLGIRDPASPCRPGRGLTAFMSRFSARAAVCPCRCAGAFGPGDAGQAHPAAWAWACTAPPGSSERCVVHVPRVQFRSAFPRPGHAVGGISCPGARRVREPFPPARVVAAQLVVQHPAAPIHAVQRIEGIGRTGFP